jgi:hypothetical protein
MVVPKNNSKKVQFKIGLSLPIETTIVEKPKTNKINKNGDNAVEQINASHIHKKSEEKNPNILTTSSVIVN